MPPVSRFIVSAFVAVIALFAAGTADAADYYLDAVNGADNNPGTLAAPWKTLSKVNANSLKLNAGDTINFKSGQTFTGGPLKVNNSGSATGGRIIYRTYGGTPSATIHSASTNGDGVQISGKSYVNLENLIITSDWVFATGATTTSGHGITVSGNMAYITLDGVEVTKFGGYGVLFDRTSGMADGIRIVNSNVHHVGNSAIRLRGQWKNYNFRDIYIGHTVVSYTKGGSANDEKASGIEVSQLDGGVIEYCEAFETGTTWSGAAGPVGIWCWDANRLIIQYSYAHHNRNSAGPYDGGGFDLDGGSTNCIVQYCYSHNNEGPGQFVAHFADSAPTNNNIIRYNISQNDGLATGQGAFNIWGASTNNQIYNNIVYGNKILFRRENGGKGTVVANNVFFASTTNNVLSSGSSSDITYRNNVWWAANGNPQFLWNSVTYTSLADWRAASGQETLAGQPTGLQVNPQFTNAGGAPTTGVDVENLANIIAYKLKSNSPLIDSATDLAALFGTGYPGARDYYGNTLPQHAAHDIGVHEYETALPALPAAPTNLAAPLVTAGRVQLTWTDNATNEGAFRIERSVNGGAFTVTDTVSENVTSWTWKSATASTSYTFRVFALNGAGVSSPAEISLTTLPPPAAPTGLSVSRAGSSELDLSWTDAASIEQGFKIERSTNGTTFTQIATVGTNVTTYRNTGLTAATTYYYRVRAYDSAVNSAYSNIASATTYPAGTATVIDNLDTANVLITGTWTSATTQSNYNATNYILDGNTSKGSKSVRFTPSGLGSGLYEVRLWWPTSNTSWAANTPVDVLHANGTSTLAVNQSQSGAAWNSLGSYYFNFSGNGSVTIRNGGTSGNVVADAVQFVRISDAMLRPPSALSTDSLTATGFTVRWTNNSSAETGTRVEVSTGGGAFIQAGVAPPGAASLAVTGLNPATAYTIRLSVFDEWGNAMPSGTANVTTLTRLAEWRNTWFPDPAAPAAANGADYNDDGILNIVAYALATSPIVMDPAGLPSLDATGASLKLSFSRPAPSEVGYVVEGSSAMSGWETVATLPAGGSVWTGTVSESGAGSTRSVTVTDTVPFSAPSRFLRLRIEY